MGVKSQFATLKFQLQSHTLLVPLARGKCLIWAIYKQTKWSARSMHDSVISSLAGAVVEERQSPEESPASPVHCFPSRILCNSCVTAYSEYQVSLGSSSSFLSQGDVENYRSSDNRIETSGFTPIANFSSRLVSSQLYPT